jgi:hypothetical protein
MPYNIYINDFIFRSSVGVAGDVMTVFYTEVTDVMKKGRGIEYIFYLQ